MREVTGRLWRRLIATLLTSTIMISTATQAQDHWRLAKSEDGIRVYTQPVAGSSFLEFKGETEIDANLQQCAGLLLSVAHMPRWMYGTKKAEVVSAVTELDRVLYMINDAPFPLRDRDLFVHNVLSQRADDSVVYSIELLADKTIDSKYVHVEVLRARVTMTPLSSHKTHVEYRAHVDPGGAVPAWAVNMFVVDTPFHTLKQARELVRTTKGSLLLGSIRNH